MKTPYAQTLRRAPTNTYLRRERDGRRRRELLLVILALVPLAAGLLGYTWVELQTLSTGYRINKLETTLHQLQRQERHLRLEAGKQAHPARIERLASERLGLQPQTVGQTVHYQQIVHPAPRLEREVPERGAGRGER